MKKKLCPVVFVLWLIIPFNCSSQVILTNITDSSYKPSLYKGEVIVLTIDDPVPIDSRQIGTVYIDLSQTTDDCELSTVIKMVQIQAQKIGGNIVKIEEVHRPNYFNHCYRIGADIYLTDKFSDYKKSLATKQDSITRKKINEESNFAILYVYRQAWYYGCAIPYDLKIGDSTICTVKNNSKYEIKLFKEGQTKIWAETETKEEKTFNVEFGKEYFLWCTVSWGDYVGRPVFMFIDKDEAQTEFKLIANKKY
jgi:hypothetical protein